MATQPVPEESVLSREWRALRSGESPAARRRVIERAYERVLAGDHTDAQRTRDDIRPLVLASWRRALAHRVNPEATPSATGLPEEELAELRRIHPLTAALPVLERLLIGEAADSGFLVAVGDATGRLLWVDGDRRMRSLAEDIGFAAGTDWSERAVGTSAPGSALALGHPIQVFGAEHFNRAVHQWSCAATPVRDPDTGAIIGVIDITGGETVAEPHVLPLVEATRAAMEAELQLESLRRRLEARPPRSRGSSSPARTAACSEPKLLLLGRTPPLLVVGEEALPVSARHAELLVALSRSPQGINGPALAEAVYGDCRREDTLRAELVRLRKFLRAAGTPLAVESRPYRFSSTLRLDADDVLQALQRGAHRLALEHYGGPISAEFEAPIISELRDDIDRTLREVLLQSSAPDLLFDYAQRWARDDREVWETLLTVLPALSPRRGLVVARLDAIAREDAPQR